jgi:hypothetical protein
LRVLVNSLPKSGTNLLSGVVRLLGFEPYGATRTLPARAAARLGLASPSSLTSETASRSLAARLGNRRGATARAEVIPIGVTSPVEVPARLVQRWLHAVPPGCAMSGHVPWSERLDAILEELGFHQVLIVRDPRDVLVSFVHYVLRGPHRLKPDLEPLGPDERFEFVLRGGVGSRSGSRVLGLVDAYRSVAAWSESPRCTLVRFEDLVGEQGGGCATRQHEAVRSIGHGLGLDLDHESIVGVCKRAFDTGSRTFRRGRVGSFRDELSPAQRERAESMLSTLAGPGGLPPRG